MKATPIIRLLLSCGTLLLCAGCQSSHHDLVSFLKAHEHEVSAIEYRVGIPDVISISSPRILEIDRVTQQIQPDGKISLRLLGAVKVVGMTEKEIAAKLTSLLAPYYEEPKVQVRVVEYRSKVIYVAGQVGSGGMGGQSGRAMGGAAAEMWSSVPYTGRDTVLDVLAKVGMTFIAERSQVHVIRSSPMEEERREITIDIDRMIRTGDTSTNVLLQPNDILYVPPTALGWLGLRVQEVLFPFQPVMQAYSTPAQVMSAHDRYTDNDDDDDNDGVRLRSLLLR